MSTNKDSPVNPYKSDNAESLGTLDAEPKNLPESKGQMDQTEMDKLAFERLRGDKKIIVEKLDGLMDRLSHPLRDILDQAKNKPANTLYDQAQMNQIEKSVMMQLTDLEKDISSKF